MTRSNSIELRALAFLSDGPLRIDWLGNIVSSRRLGSRVRCVRVVCSPWNASTQWGGGSNTAALQKTADIPVAFLRMLRVGDIWHNGVRVGSAPLIRRTFENLEINGQTASTVPAGARADSSNAMSRYELPFSQFAAHIDHTASFIARVQCPDGSTLLVPSLELVRFYFGASGTLVSKLFSGPLDAVDLFTYRHRHPTTKVANMDLAAGLPAAAAAAVSRAAFDPIAFRAMRGVVNTGVVAAAERGLWYPRMGFPFFGATDLEVDGLEVGRGTDRVFLALRLLSCTHEFPFSDLYFHVRDGGGGGGASASAATPSSDPAATPAPGRSAPRMRLGAAQTNSRLASLIVATDHGDDPDPFPDLAKKRVVKVREDRGAAPAKPTAEPEPADYHGPDGAPGSKDAPRGADLVQTQRIYIEGHPEPRSLVRLRDAIAQHVPEMTVSSSLAGVPAQRVVFKIGAFQVHSMAVWICTFLYQIEEARAAMLCITDEAPLTPESIEMVMFSVDPDQPPDGPTIQAMARVCRATEENLMTAARGMSMRVAWTARTLQFEEPAEVAVGLVQMMIDTQVLTGQ